MVIRAGRHEARRHRVHGGDAERPQLLRKLLHQTDLTVLGRSVGLDTGQAGREAGAARDRDDPAAARRLHAGRHGAGEQEAAQQVVSVDDGRKVLRRDVFEWLGLSPGPARRPRHRPARRPCRRLACHDRVDARRHRVTSTGSALMRSPGFDLVHQPIGTGDDRGAVVGEGARDRADRCRRAAPATMTVLPSKRMSMRQASFSSKSGFLSGLQITADRDHGGGDQIVDCAPWASFSKRSISQIEM